MFDANMCCLKKGHRFFASFSLGDDNIHRKLISDDTCLVLCEMLENTRRNPTVQFEFPNKTVIMTESDFGFDSFFKYQGNEDLSGFNNDWHLDLAKQMKVKT